MFFFSAWGVLTYTINDGTNGVFFFFNAANLRKDKFSFECYDFSACDFTAFRFRYDRFSEKYTLDGTDRYRRNSAQHSDPNACCTRYTRHVPGTTHGSERIKYEIQISPSSLRTGSVWPLFYRVSELQRAVMRRNGVNGKEIYWTRRHADSRVRKTSVYLNIISNFNLNASCSAVHRTFAQHKRDFSKCIDLYVSLYTLISNRIRYVENRMSSTTESIIHFYLKCILLEWT